MAFNIVFRSKQERQTLQLRKHVIWNKVPNGLWVTEKLSDPVDFKGKVHNFKT